MLVTPQKEQREAAIKIKAFLAESTKKGLFAQFFGTYSDTMFAQLLVFCKFRELQRGSILYERGHQSSEFYYVFNGEVHLAIDENGEKATRTIEAGMIFGFREYLQASNDFATAKQPDTQVIEIPSFIYREIITQT